MLDKLNGFKTFIGIVVSVLPTLLPLVGISFGADDAELINSTVDAVITAIGGLIATYGRVVAKINHAKE